MSVTKVRIRSRLREGKLVHCAHVRKGACLAIHVVGRTELPIGNAGRAASNTVAAAYPCPAHRVAYRNVDRVWRKCEALSH
jgi:hypothetical protein